jgi:hypothetical protein
MFSKLELLSIVTSCFSIILYLYQIKKNLIYLKIYRKVYFGQHIEAVSRLLKMIQSR